MQNSPKDSSPSPVKKNHRTNSSQMLWDRINKEKEKTKGIGACLWRVTRLACSHTAEVHRAGTQPPPGRRRILTLLTLLPEPPPANTPLSDPCLLTSSSAVYALHCRLLSCSRSSLLSAACYVGLAARASCCLVHLTPHAGIGIGCSLHLTDSLSCCVGPVSPHCR